jgi:hypothetical protein
MIFFQCFHEQSTLECLKVINVSLIYYVLIFESTFECLLAGITCFMCQFLDSPFIAS